MNTLNLAKSALAVAALLALAAGSAHAAPKAAREAASAQGPRGLITGKVSPQIVQRADGSQEIEHDESMLNTSVVVRQADGSLKQFCVPNAEIARRMAAGQRVSFAKNMLERTNDR